MTGPTNHAWRIPEHICVAVTDYGAILLDQRSGRYYQLNPTAALVVDGLVDGADPDAIAARLTELYDVSAEQARSDVAGLTAELQRAGTLERTAA